MENDPLRMPPLPALRAFYAVGTAGSIRKAAEDLGVTHTAVVRQVRALEAWLGASLIETTPKGTALNPEGRKFHVSVKRAFAIISDATAEIRPIGQTRELRICAPPGFATFWILPRLHEIQRQLSSVSFEISPFETERFDPNECDVLVAYGEVVDKSLVAIELVRSKMRVLASERWIASHPEVRKACDLRRVELVHERSKDVWRTWFDALSIESVGLKGPRVGALTTVLEAVHMDQGPGVFAEIFVDERLTRGTLLQVVPETPRVSAYSLVTTPERYADPVIRRFSDWLVGSLAHARSS